MPTRRLKSAAISITPNFEVTQGRKRPLRDCTQISSPTNSSNWSHRKRIISSRYSLSRRYQGFRQSAAENSLDSCHRRSCRSWQNAFGESSNGHRYRSSSRRKKTQPNYRSWLCIHSRAKQYAPRVYRCSGSRTLHKKYALRC